MTIALTLGCMGVVALADNDKVEISFCVGDETLMINGQAVVVEKPYVVGAGVTLVPLRVITEAFGAEVLWEGETKTITLKYPDVNIVLQIGNPVAEINGRAEELLAAPELTSNGYTVVPLRFISENFGATVSYDDATKRITVVKELSASTGATVEGGIETIYVGDSYFKWYMENPKEMTMTLRRFDGRKTEFSYDENNVISISIVNMTEGFNLEKTFSNLKNLGEGKTLIKSEKDSQNKTIHLQFKDKNKTYVAYHFATDKYGYDVQAIFENSDEARKNEGVRIIDSFTIGYVFEDIYDLSNVKNSVRRFESEDMNLSIDIPGEYIMATGEDAYNEFEFVSGDNKGELAARVSVAIYSKKSAGTAEELANYDLKRNSKGVNSSISTFSDKLTRASYNSIYTTAYQYEYEINTLARKTYTRDVFFEIGEYVYNIAVTILQPGDKKQVDDIINSLSAKEIDSSVVGDIIYNSEIIEDTYEVDDLYNCSFNLPVSYEAVEAADSTVSYTDGINLFSGGYYPPSGNEKYDMDDIEYTASKFASDAASEQGAMHMFTENETYGGKDYIIVTLKTVNGTTVTYSEIYFTLHDGAGYIFNVFYSELSYSEAKRDEIRKIFESAKFGE